jgi:D-tagatose-1,6-bisphosphate aldolase subunit GatZ/KbaZ
LQDAWPRVVGLVVQPGVEFDHDKVIDYISSKARDLSASIQPYTHMVFEAHSTDYQLPANLKGLVENHFAILKVGPGVTYAMREAIWALDALEQEWLGKAEASCVKDTILGVMNGEPRYWQSYYHGKGRQLDIEKQFSFSDRIRYYWPHKKVVSALNRMKENFKNGKPPLTLLSQFLPAQFLAVREGKIPYQVEEIVIHKIQEVLSQYSDACMQ